ncbi:hypothetical protein PISMIDRAFT_119074, partial [Pisolithus microcarpus 441]
WSIEDRQQQGPTMQADRRVYSIAVSRDGLWVVSGDYGNKAIVWNALTNEAVRHTRYRHSVYAVDISSDCTRVVAASYDDADNVRLSGTASGTELLPPISHRYVVGVKFSPDSSRFATASYYDGVRVYGTYDGKVFQGTITSVNISDSSSSEWPIHAGSIVSNGRFIACSAGSSVSLWDCMSQKQIGSLITHSTVVGCIALSPSGGYLACGVGNNITVHDLRDVLSSKYFVRGVSELRHCAT